MGFGCGSHAYYTLRVGRLVGQCGTKGEYRVFFLDRAGVVRAGG